MRPESTSVTYRPDLSVLSKEFEDQKAAGRFIANRAAPIIEVAEASGGYPIFNRESFKKPVSSGARASGGAYPRIIGDFGKGTYDCEDYGIEYPLDDRMKNKYKTLFDAERAAARIVTYQTLLAREIRVSALFSGGGFTANAASTVWSTSSSAVPFNDIETGINTLSDNCGVGKGGVSLIIPRAALREMLSTTQVGDKSKYTMPGVQPAMLEAAQVAAMLGIKEVLVAGSSYDSTEEGYAESMSQIWAAGTIYLCVLADEGDTIEEPSAARTALWTGDSPTLPVFESYREEHTRTDVIRERMDVDEFLQGATDLFVYAMTT